METKIRIKEETGKTRELPAIALRGMVIFPDSRIQFDIGREKSVKAVMEAMEGDRLVFLSAQKDIAEDNPGGRDIYEIGVIAKVNQIFRQNRDHIVRVNVEGLNRARVQSVVHNRPYIRLRVMEIEEIPGSNTARAQALVRKVKELYDEYVRLVHSTSPDIILNVIKEEDCGKLADYIAANINLEYDLKAQVLSQISPIRRIEKLSTILKNEIEVLTIENELSEKTREVVDEGQREYYLREQMKIIAEELGEDDSPGSDARELREKILALKMPQEQEKTLLKECDKLARMPYGAHEAGVLRSYLELCCELPWSRESRISLDLKKAERILNADHYGLVKVKERILETLAVRKLSPGYNKQIICLVGPPGVGKTSVAKSIARATGRVYQRISLGGIQDEADIVGHRKTYVGAMPGRIISAMKQAGVRNPLILLDEIDKLGLGGFKGDPAAALLEVLDPEQNSAFYDHYVDLPFDLSHVLFITTANDASTIPAPLYDRMDVITLSSYTYEEKYQIAVRHLVPKQLKEHSISKSQLHFTPAAIRAIIDGYTREAGVRTLERRIASICRKTARKIVSGGENEKYTVTPNDLEELLGPQLFKEDDWRRDDEIGVVNGLAWTSVGGELLEIEVSVTDGSGKIELTGSLGNVMKESASAAITFLRAHAEEYGIQPDFYKTKDLHIHAPEGAVPKDGPSAGVTMATALASALLSRPVRADIAMTGEITLRGRVLPIGGLREKSMAAYRAGIKTVFIPYRNLSDLSEIEQVVKDKIRFVPVKYAGEILSAALLPKYEEAVPHLARVNKKQGEVRI